MAQKELTGSPNLAKAENTFGAFETVTRIEHTLEDQGIHCGSKNGDIEATWMVQT